LAQRSFSYETNENFLTYFDVSDASAIHVSEDNNTNFNYKTGHERPLRTTTHQKPYYPKYDDDGNKIELIKELGKHLQPVNNVKYKTVLV
jgi:hypothetical protein